MSCGPSGRYYLTTTNRAQLHAALFLGESKRKYTIQLKECVQELVQYIGKVASFSSMNHFAYNFKEAQTE